MTNPSPPSRLRLRYCKDEILQYVGHRDMLRLILRILRQARIPFAMSKGYSPKPKVSFAPALPLGVMADNELVDIELAEGVIFSTQDIITTGQRIAEAAEPRRFLVSLDLLPPHSPSLAHSAVYGRYELRYADDINKLESVMAADTMLFEHKDKVIDLRLGINRWKIEDSSLYIEANVGASPVLNIVRLTDYIEETANLCAKVITRHGLLNASGHEL